MDDHGIQYLVVVLFRVGFAQLIGFFQGVAGRDVTEAQVVRGCLVSDHVRNDTAPFQFGQDVCNIAQQANREPPRRLVEHIQRLIQAF